MCTTISSPLQRLPKQGFARRFDGEKHICHRDWARYTADQRIEQTFRREEVTLITPFTRVFVARAINWRIAPHCRLSTALWERIGRWDLEATLQSRAIDGKH